MLRRLPVLATLALAVLLLWQAGTLYKVNSLEKEFHQLLLKEANDVDFNSPKYKKFVAAYFQLTKIDPFPNELFPTVGSSDASGFFEDLFVDDEFSSIEESPRKVRPLSFEYPLIKLLFQERIPSPSEGDTPAALDRQFFSPLSSLLARKMNNLDFTWMNELGSYDYFDLDKFKQFQENISADPAWYRYRVEPEEFRFSRFSAGDWAMLRLIKAAQNPKVEGPSAFLEVRRLAYLLMTTEDLGFQSDAQDILSVEMKAYTAFKARGFAPHGWSPPAQNESKLSKLTKSWKALGDILISYRAKPIIQDFFAENKKTWATCGVLREALARHLESRFLMNRWYPDSNSSLEWAYQENKNVCRLGLVGKHWENRDYRDLKLESKMARNRFPYLLLIPFTDLKRVSFTWRLYRSSFLSVKIDDIISD